MKSNKQNNLNMPEQTLTKTKIKTSTKIGIALIALGASIAFAVITYTPGAPVTVSAEDIVSWWPGDENANDIVGANNGTLRNGAVISSASLGYVAPAFQFDGLDDDVIVGPLLSNLLADQFTIEFWANPGATSDRPTFGFSDSISANTNNPLSSYDSGLSIGNGAGGSQLLTALPLASAATWTHYAIVDDGTNYRVYVNGVEQDINGGAAGLAAAIITNPASQVGRQFVVGQSGFSGGYAQHFNGRIDEFTIYNRALAAAEVSAIYSAGALGKGKNLPPAIITAGTLPEANVSIPYSKTLDVVLGTPPHTWSLSGAPSWLTIGSGTGVLSGTPTAGGTWTFTVNVSDSAGTTGSKIFNLTAVTPPAPLVSTETLPFGYLYTPYSAALAAAGTGPLSWSVSGAPSWLSINSSTGALTGTPSSAATISLTVSATDLLGQIGSRTLTLTVKGCKSLGLYGPRSWWTGNSGEHGYSRKAIDVWETNHGNLLTYESASDASFAFVAGKVGQAFTTFANRPAVSGLVDVLKLIKIRVSNSLDLRPTNVTVEAWVKSTSPSFGAPYGSQYIACKAYTPGGTSLCSYAFQVDGGNLTFQVKRTDLTTVNSPTAAASVWGDGNWHHVAGTYDGSYVRLYVDGNQMGSGTSGSGSILYATDETGDLFIGAKAGTATISIDPFYGVIDELAVWGYALPEVAIDQIVDAGASGKCSPDWDEDGIANALDKDSLGADQSRVFSTHFVDNDPGATSGDIAFNDGFFVRITDLPDSDPVPENRGVLATASGAGEPPPGAALTSCTSPVIRTLLDAADESATLTCGSGTVTARRTTNGVTVEASALNGKAVLGAGQGIKLESSVARAPTQNTRSIEVRRISDDVLLSTLKPGGSYTFTTR